MILDRSHLTGLVIPDQHIGMIHGMWNKLGKPTPWALALGAPPAAMIAGGAPMPAYINEPDYISQLTGERVEVVECETVDLEVPASAEIVIEGSISDHEMAMEGPFGEYGGYMYGPEPKPWPKFTVTAITYRDRAILPVIAAGVPVEDIHTLWGLGISGEALDLCRQAKLPVTACWTPYEAATHWMVVTVPLSWHSETGLGVNEFVHRIGQTIFDSHAGWQFPKILVMGDDIDPTNLGQVVWAFATRCHPGSGEIQFSQTKVGEWVAYLDSSEKLTGRGGQCSTTASRTSRPSGDPCPRSSHSRGRIRRPCKIGSSRTGRPTDFRTRRSRRNSGIGPPRPTGIGGSIPPIRSSRIVREMRGIDETHGRGDLRRDRHHLRRPPPGGVARCWGGDAPRDEPGRRDDARL